jgi:hypothetical protein
LALSHDAATDAWTLTRGLAGGASPGRNAIRLDGPGFPIVSVVDDAGHAVFALIDTGTPKSLVDQNHRPGHYRVTAADGSTLLHVDATEVAPWTGLAPRGRDIAIWIGLDDLAQRSFTIDFASGWWVFTPVPAPAAPFAAPPTTR